MAMLVVRSRRHVIWYTRKLRQVIQQLPEESRFGVLAVFSPFVFEGRNRTENDVDINGDYARRSDKQYGIVGVTQEPTSDVRLLVVADKLQTGYDEPRVCSFFLLETPPSPAHSLFQMSMLFIDKPLRGSHVVQTLGRLSRIAPVCSFIPLLHPF